ncbi:MAG: hypothetical protein ATN36_04775 [Epulopiscium sp. Nele67-Bin005]|nr:MAG: hypothetical protein ATN36_04775 [Epulopiscium sp. Nele67-Bin005]
MKLKVLGISMLAVSLSLVGCGSEETQQPSTPVQNDTTQNDDNEIAQEPYFTIGISQLVEHPALDSVREGFIHMLEEELDVNVYFSYQNAQGDIANTQLIAQKMVSDDVDLIFTIATLATQSAKQVTQNTDIPVIFSAVTDPVYSEIVLNLDAPEANITGTMDYVDSKSHLELFKMIDPSVDTIGIIYNTGESNSEVQVAQAIEAAKDLGLTIKAVGITSVNDISQAVQSLSKDAQGLYLITDNLISTATTLVAELAKTNGLITVSASENQAEEGILLAGGVDYYNLGRQSAQMAYEILINNTPISQIPVEATKETTKYVNETVLETLNLDKTNPAFDGATFVK